LHWKLPLAALFIAAAIPLPAQSGPAAIYSSLQVNAGLGYGVYHDDFEGPGVMEGPTIWFDIYPNRGPNLLKGFGLDLEARDISFGRPPTQPSNLREDSTGGGIIYSWRHFRNFSPYGKFDREVGGIDFHTNDPHYNHDAKLFNAYGAGIECRLVKHVSVRAAYELQVWQRLFQDPPNPGIVLKPRGVTVGAFYEFHHIHTRATIDEK
jgi:Outer membrane protein beta-barrel domain